MDDVPELRASSTPERRSPLGPETRVQKFLISSTCRFVDVLEMAGLEVQHAFFAFSRSANTEHLEQGSAARGTYVLAFKTAPPEDHVVLSNFQPLADLVVAYASLLFGKRFDSTALRKSLVSTVCLTSRFLDTCTLLSAVERLDGARGLSPPA